MFIETGVSVFLTPLGVKCGRWLRGTLPAGTADSDIQLLTELYQNIKRLAAYKHPTPTEWWTLSAGCW